MDIFEKKFYLFLFSVHIHLIKNGKPVENIPSLCGIILFIDFLCFLYQQRGKPVLRNLYVSVLEEEVVDPIYGVSFPFSRMPEI